MKNSQKQTRIILFTLFLLLLITPASASSELETTIITTTPIDLGKSSTTYIALTETRGETDAKDITVDVEIRSTNELDISLNLDYTGGVITKQSSNLYCIEYHLDEIPKGSFCKLLLPIKYSEDMAPGTVTISTTTSYYSTELLGLKTTGPYYTSEYKNIILEDPYGKVDIITTPENVNVYMNGIYKGITPLSIEKITPGEYTFTFQKNGYFEETTTKTISKGKKSTVSYSLLRNTFDVSFISKPSNADVYIDGNYRGKTPLVLTFPVGTNQVEFKKDGYKSETQSLEFSKYSSTSECNVVLKEIPTTPSPTPTTQTTTSSSAASSRPSSSSNTDTREVTFTVMDTPSSSSSSQSNQSPGFGTLTTMIVIGIISICIKQRSPRKR